MGGPNPTSKRELPTHDVVKDISLFENRTNLPDVMRNGIADVETPATA
jgi:hypothetical protein